jgi:hypothetical protein
MGLLLRSCFTNQVILQQNGRSLFPSLLLEEPVSDGQEIFAGGIGLGRFRVGPSVVRVTTKAVDNEYAAAKLD